MATGQIKRSEIAESDLYKEIRDSAQKTIQELNSLNSELKKSAEIIKNDLSVGLEKTTLGIQKLTKASIDSEKIMQQSIKTESEKAKLQKEMLKADQEIERLNQQKEKTEQQRIRTQQQLNRETERQTKQNERLAKQTKDQNDAYKQLVIQTRDAKNESKRLGAEMLQLEKNGQKNTAEYKKLSKQYSEVTKEAQKGDQQLKKLDKTVGDNFRNVGNYSSALNGLSKVLGTVGIAFGIGSTIRNVTGIVMDFDQAVADLGAISGKTSDELSPLIEQSKQLGATTQFSATQITEMQIELAKLGFTTEQILDSTGAISNFASATGTDIPRASSLAGASLRAFNLQASEMERVVSVLGVATTKTALDVSQLETGLSTVAPVASAFGFSIEDTVALLGQLANAGFDASSSATATRNILLSLADSNGELAKQLGRPIKTADDLSKGLQELKGRGIDLAEALELTDKRSVAAFATFLEGSGTLVELRDSITDVSDELSDMAEKRLQTVNGSLQLLNSAWEGFILDLNEGTRASEFFSTTIRFVADNLTTIIGMIPRLAGYFLLYRNRVKLAQMAQYLFNGGLMGSIKAIPQMISGLRSGTTSINGFSTAMKKIPFVAVVSGITELIFWIGGQKKAVDELTDSERELNEQMERGNEIRNQRSNADKDIETQINRRVQLSQSELKLLKQQIESEIEALELNTSRQKIRSKQEDEQSEKTRKRREKELKELKEFNLFENETFEDRKRAIQQLELQLEQSSINIRKRNEERDAGLFNDQTEIELLKTRRNQLELIIPLIKDETKIQEKKNTKLEKQNKELERLAKIYEDLIKLEDELFFRSQDDETREIMKRLEQFDDETQKIDLATMVSIEERNELEKRLREEVEQDISKIREKYRQQRLDDELKMEIDISERAFNERIKQIQENELNSLITENEGREDRLFAEIMFLEEKRQLLEDSGKDVLEIEMEILDKRLELQKFRNQQELENQRKIVDSEKQAMEERLLIVRELTETFNELTDQRIQKMNEEMSMAQKRFDFYSDLAKNGNIDAKQSLAEEQRIIDEAQRQREKLEKQKQRVQLVSGALQSYIRNTENPDVKNPLVKTFSDVTLLTQFIKSLPAFEKGIEDTGKNGTGVDGKGGFLSVLHPNERVLTKDQNSKIGSISNDELSNLALKFRNGELQSVIHKTESKQNPETNEIVNRLKSLEQTIKNKPETNIELERIVDGAMTILKTTTSGNTKIFNRYRTQR